MPWRVALNVAVIASVWRAAAMDPVQDIRLQATLASRLYETSVERYTLVFDRMAVGGRLQAGCNH